ncbi:MAG: LysR family transcriptional regulator [Gammaproteobacteria bacterium]|nr:LysR family transcriptional regulator [Gammaproteobacteria bacterium]
MKDTLATGVTLKKRFEVDKPRTIDFMGEKLRVYATPAMIWDIEGTCRDLTLPHLDDGEDSVGARIEADHLGATLLGMSVEITATVTEVDGRRVSFDVVVHDALELVGRARHIRFVIDKDRQKQRLEAKAEKARAAE